jgi:hypothetical protein
MTERTCTGIGEDERDVQRASVWLCFGGFVLAIRAAAQAVGVAPVGPAMRRMIKRAGNSHGLELDLRVTASRHLPSVVCVHFIDIAGPGF